jgi:hypothetical protein
VLIDVSVLIATDVIVDGPKRAVLVGTVAGVQFALVFQSLVEGVALHVAFWACAETAESETPASSAAMRKRACDRPDPCLTGPATPNSPFASSRGKTATPRMHPREAIVALRLCPGRAAPRARAGNCRPYTEYPSTARRSDLG